MALLEQKKARTTLSSAEDDEILENTYMKASTVPKKRTRTDILNELKQKRSELGRTCDQVDSGNAAQSKDGGEILEEAKKQGKFKPFGFKPIGNSGEREKRKKLKSGDGTAKDGERKKKKHKVEAEPQEPQAERKTELPSTAEILIPMPTTSKANTGPEPEPEPEPESLGDDFDIFAGAGEYEGIDLGNDDDEEEGEVELELPTERGDTLLGLVSTVGSKGWFVTEDDEIETTSIPSGPAIQLSTSQGSGSQIPSAPPGGRPRDDRYGDGQTGEVSDEREQQPVRLQPLSSSALPSIRDFLAMDEAAEAAEKRRKRKEKKKNGGGSGGAGSKSVEEKVNRDYQRLAPNFLLFVSNNLNFYRLQSYTTKREASGSRYHLSPYNSQFEK